MLISTFMQQFDCAGAFVFFGPAQHGGARIQCVAGKCGSRKLNVIQEQRAQQRTVCQIAAGLAYDDTQRVHAIE